MGAPVEVAVVLVAVVPAEVAVVLVVGRVAQEEDPAVAAVPVADPAVQVAVVGHGR